MDQDTTRAMHVELWEPLRIAAQVALNGDEKLVNDYTNVALCYALTLLMESRVADQYTHYEVREILAGLASARSIGRDRHADMTARFYSTSDIPF